MACTFEVKTIEPTECIGNSLDKINENFESLKENACQNYNKIEILESRITILDTQISNLSAITVPGVLRAWIKFDGTRDTSGAVNSNLTNRFIYSAFNIGRVQTVGVGDYRIFFNAPFPASNYVAVGTSSLATSEGKRTWLQPYDYRTTFLGVKVASVDGSSVAANHISIVFY
jgi:hypothetical protein